MRQLKPIEACDWVEEIRPACAVAVVRDCRRGSPPPSASGDRTATDSPVSDSSIGYISWSVTVRSGDAGELASRVFILGLRRTLSAIVALLSGPYRQSYRQVIRLMAELFGVRLREGVSIGCAMRSVRR